MSVGTETDDRPDNHREGRRDRHHHWPGDEVRGFELFKHQLQHRCDGVLAHLLGEVAPEQPAEEHGESVRGVGECASLPSFTPTRQGWRHVGAEDGLGD